MVRVRTYVSAKSLGSKRAQAAMFSWIVDVYIQIPCHIVLLGRPWISAPRLLQLEFTIVVYRTRLTCFRFFQLHLWLSLQPMAATRRGHIWCDVKLRLRHTSRDERAQALCANFVLQATNAQGLGTRLGILSQVNYHFLY